jgi:recombinational DNA repair ATPase RecF
VFIAGRNGSGKTSILEAISMVNGRSVIGNNLSVIKNGTKDALITLSYNDLYDIKIALSSGRTGYMLNDKNVKLNQINSIIKTLTFNPFTHHSFISKSERRDLINFYIGLVYAEYAALLLSYNKLCSERMKLLSSNNSNFNDKWVYKIETQIAEIAFNLCKFRNHFVVDVKEYLKSFFNHSVVDDLYIQYQDNFDGFKNIFLERLANNRALDAKSGRMNFSAHRYNTEIEKNGIIFNNFSHSEQKMLLIDLVCAVSVIINKKFHISPVLLIDEITASFDEKNIEIVIEKISGLFGQIFITAPQINQGLVSKFNMQVIDIS